MGVTDLHDLTPNKNPGYQGSDELPLLSFTGGVTC